MPDMSEQTFIFSYFCSFRTLCIFGHKMQMLSLIKLKLGTHKGLIKAHLHTNFGRNPIKIYRLIFRIKKVKGLSCLHGKPLEEIG